MLCTEPNTAEQIETNRRLLITHTASNHEKTQKKCFLNDPTECALQMERKLYPR
jgi:hypothetical protein